MAKSGRKKRTGLKVILALLLLIAAIGAFLVFGPSSPREEYLYIHTGSDYNTVLKQLEQGGFVREMNSFKLLAQRAGYPTRVKPGKYKIERGMSSYNIIRMLRNGRQEPVKLVINKLRTKQDLINFVSSKLEVDSNALKAMMQDSALLAAYGLDTNTAMCAIIPDTYEFYWNTNAEKVFRKIAKNYNRFWTDARKQLAKAHGLSPAEAITMASIVEEETNKVADKPLIASVYINRIKKDMPLQADPTVKFAVGDFSIKRVTGVHLKQESPYNTYLHKGLPPGPVCTPSVNTINSVLNAPPTDYIYFCATPALDGSSAFTASYEKHLSNARAYQQALNQRGIH
jgi:UPF0755 protein